MMKSALQSLYDSSISYGMKKQLVASQDKQEKASYEASLKT